MRLRERELRVRLGLLLAIFLLACVPGCGADSSVTPTQPLVIASPLPSPLPGASPAASPSSGPSPSPTVSPSPVAPALATLTVQLVLEQLRTVQAYVRTVRISGLDSSGRRVYGPVERPKQATLIYPDVPSNVVEVQLDFLIEGTVTGIFRGPVNLTSGAATINDPPFVDVNTVRSLNVIGTSSLALGSRAQLVCNGTFTDGATYDLTTAVRWASWAMSVATVSATGEVTGLAPGTAAITASRDALANSLTVTVTPAALVSLAVSPASASIATFSTQAFTARGTFSDNTTQDLTTQVAWSSSNASAASISPTGLAAAGGPGSTTIRASQAGISGTASLAVSGPTVVNAVIVPANPQVRLFAYQSFGLNATLSNGSVQNLTAQASWTSSEPSVAAVIQPGEIRGINRGTAVLTAAVGGVQAQTNVTVTDNAPPPGPTPTPAVRFAAAVNFPVPARNPQQMVAGNFTADGLADLATANEPQNDVAVLLNSGGAFGAAAFFPVGGVGPAGIATASVDAGTDSFLDLVTADETSNNISLLRGNGAGAFGAPTRFATNATAAPTGPFGVVLGLFNGDAFLDVATANFVGGGMGGLSILLNDAGGTGAFGAPVQFDTGSGPDGIASGLFNADAFLDVAVSCSSSNAVTVRFGNGAGAFPTFVNVTVGTSPSRILARDLNGDGSLDFATANFGVNTISLVYGNGAGGFAPALTVVVGSGPAEVAAGDFNGDGLLDLAVANNASNSVSILTGNGSGTYTLAATLTVGVGPMSIVAADFNGDGRLDLATANQTGNSVSLLLQQP